jgi:phage protein D
MELSALASTYGDFYAPSYAVRIGRDDLMRDLLVAVSQVEVDMVLGAASRFTFTVSDSYSHKLHAFKSGGGDDVLKLLHFGTEVTIRMGYGDLKSTPVAVSGIITEITTDFPDGGSPSADTTTGLR